MQLPLLKLEVATGRDEGIRGVLVRPGSLLGINGVLNNRQKIHGRD